VGGDDAEKVLIVSDRKANDYFALIRASGELENPYGDPYGINEYVLGVRSAIDD
jgi:hypothetical protein